MSRYVPQELEIFAKDLALKNGYQLVDIVLKGGETPQIEVIVDKKERINLDECARFNREIIKWIDEHRLFGGRYELDVCSPGLDRVLKSDNDYEWATGKKVRFILFEPVEGKREISGIIRSLNVETREVTIEISSGTVVNMRREKIAHARLTDIG